MTTAAPEVEGQMSPQAVEGIAGEHNSALMTLDEPVSATIMRDLKMVGKKLYHVLLPRGGSDDTLKALRDWDLWGPLLLCLLLSIFISASASAGQTSLVFAAVFVLVWAGAGVVSLNAQLLGGNLSFFQSVCVLGYCIFPLVLASAVSALISNTIVRGIAVTVALAWSTRASVVFMGDTVVSERRMLAVFPVCLFYIVMAWMVYVQ